MLELKIKMCVF